jgi:N-acetylglucosamine-6-phosphate deacetylase
LETKHYVDIQVNGYKGVDFSADDLTLDGIRSVTKALAERGTVAYCPTVCTGSMEMYKRNLPMIVESMDDPMIAGIHLEGPFISSAPGAVGAHKVDCVRTPNVDDFKRMQEYADGKVAILTLAPEEPGADKLIEYAAGQGVAVMFGHHLADSASMARGVAAGAKGCTHVGNGLPNQIDRHKNPLWYQLACDELVGSFITDGHHLPADFIKVAFRAKGINNFIVTSDAAPLAGMEPGIYGGFGKQVEVSASGRVSVAGTPYLAGSGATMKECMAFLGSLGILSEEELYQVSFVNPLRLLGKTPESFGK